MTISELKQYIYSQDKISFILEELGCTKIKYHPTKQYFTCCNADNGDNPNAVIVYCNDSLSVTNYTRDLTKYDSFPDIITLVKYYQKIDFRKAIKWLHKVLGLKYNSSSKSEETIVDPLRIFKSINKYKRGTFEYQVLEENLLADFYPYVHKDFAAEGIFKNTIKKFQLGYSYDARGTIIPIRHWCHGGLIGVIRRTSIENYEMFDIPKYFPLKAYAKSNNVYGLWENGDFIQEAGYCVIFEGQKSVLKRDSIGFKKDADNQYVIEDGQYVKDYTSVAVCGHDISEEQVRILAGLNLKELIIAFDKDVSLNEIRGQCEKFYGIRNVSYIYDSEDILGEHDAPIDKGNDTYWYLYYNRVQYDANEHEEYKKYLQSLKKK